MTVLMVYDPLTMVLDVYYIHSLVLSTGDFKLCKTLLFHVVYNKFMMSFIGTHNRFIVLTV